MKKYLFLIIKIVVSISLLYFIFLQVDWHQFPNSIKSADLNCLFMAFILGAVFNLIKFLKWKALINSHDQKHSYLDSAKSYMIGNALGMVTPMRAGDLGRALYFVSKERPRIMLLTIKDRFIDLIIVFLIAIAGSFILVNKGFGLLIIMLFGSGLLILYGPFRTHDILMKVIPERFLKGKFNNMIKGFSSLNRRTTSYALILSLVSFLIIIVEFYYLVLAYEDINLVSIYLVAPLITISTILPISIMGFGVREGLSIYLLAKFGVSPTAALSAAFLFFIINNFSISLIGVFFLAKIKVSKNTALKEI